MHSEGSAYGSWARIRALEKQLVQIDCDIDRSIRKSPIRREKQRLMESVPGVGSLGLVPRQHSSGNRNVPLGISKRGDRYLRTLLIHGARSALSRAERRSDRRSL